MAAYRPDVTRISRYEWDISELPGETPFLLSRNTVGLVWTPSYARVSNISKMAACNRKYMEWRLSQLVREIATKFQGYTYVSDVKQHDWTDLHTAVFRGEWEIKDGGL